MAGQDREIALVIRAKNDATKAIDSVSAALKQLVGFQDDVGQSAVKTDSLLSELAETFAGFSKQAEALGALGTVAKSLDKASESVSRLENQVRAAADAAAPLAEQYEQAAEASAQLAERANQAKTALEQQGAVTAEAKEQQAALSAAVKQAEESYRSIYGAISAARVPSEELRASYRDQLSTLLQLYEAQEEAKSVYGQQREALGASKAEASDLDAQLRAAAAAEDKLGQESTRANDALGRAQGNLQKARDELAAIAEMADKASGALGGVEVTQDAVGRASQETAANLDRVKGALGRQQAITPDQGPAASGPAASATSAYRAQVQATRDAKAAWDQAKESATALGEAVSRAAEPTKQLQVDFLLARQAAVEAEAAYMANAAALNELHGVTQGNLTEFLRMAGALDQERVAVIGAGQALEGLPNVTNKVGQNTFSLRGLLAAFLQIPGASEEAGDGVRRFGQSAGEGSGIVNRMRNEIVGLATAYLGFYGAINQVGGIIKTVRDLESAQSRLGVVFDGDQKAAAGEIQFVMAQAERLGIAFDSLSTEYTKVAIAAKEANFSTDATRQIFLAFTEASRVAGLSTTDMESAFLGLRESIERGTLNARNFNIEIGSRIPGAMQAMAAAIGVSVSKFTELQRGGNSVAASQDTLVKFAENLRAKYADELPEAVKTLNAEIGRFQTTIAKAQIEIAKGGFADALKDALTQLDAFFQSDSGEQFFTRLGRVLGQLVGLLPAIVQNFGLIATAARTFVSIKIAEYVLSLIGGSGKLSVALKAAAVDVDRLAGAMGALNAEKVAGVFSMLRANIASAAGAMAALDGETLATAAGTAVLDGALAALRGLMIGVAGVARAMWLAVGGVPGLIITAFTFIVSGLLGDWIGGVDKATDALDAHGRMLDRVKQGYADAVDGADKLKQKIQEVSTVQVEVDSESLKRQLDDARNKVQGPANAYGTADPKNTVSKIQAAVTAFQSGRTSALAFKAAVNSIAEADPHLDRNLAAQLLNSADKAAGLEKAIQEDDAILRVLRGTATDADKTLLGLGESAKTVAGALDTAPLEAYTKALRDMQKEIPGLAKAAEAATKTQQLDDALKSGMLALQGNLTSADPKVKAQAQAQAAQLQAAHDAAVNQLQGSAALDQSMTGGNGAALLATARKYLGENQHKDESSLTKGLGIDPDKVAWCAAFINMVLKQNNLPTSGSLSARSFLNYGTDVSADKAEPGDIVILKGVGGPGSGHVGLFDGLNANGSVRVLGGNQHGGQVNEETFPARDVVGMRRAPGGSEVYKQEAKSEDAVEAFAAFLDQMVADLKKDAAAKTLSPRDAFIQSKLKEVDDRVARSGPTAENPNAPTLTVSPDQRQAISDAAGADFDAQQDDATKKKNAELEQQLRDKEKQDVSEITAATLAQERAEYIKNAALKDGVNLLSQQGKIYGDLQGKMFDQSKSQDLFSNVMGLNDQKKELVGQLKDAMNDGDSDKVAALKAQLADILAKLQQLLPLAKQFAESMGDQKMLSQLDQVKTKVETIQIQITNAKQVNDMFVNGFMSGFDRAVDAISSGVDGVKRWGQAWTDAGNAFLSFASDFLKQIAEMILKAQLLQLIQSTGWGKSLANGINSLTSGATGQGGQAAAAAGLQTAGTSLSTSGELLTTASQAWNVTAEAIQTAAETLGSSNGAGAGAGGGGGLLSFLGMSGAGGAGASADAASTTADMTDVAGLFHSGGEVGTAGGMTRRVSVASWLHATRYHTGGVAGLAPDEVPAILQRGERVLTQSQARQMGQQQGGQGGQGPGASPVKIVNAFNGSDMLASALADEVGQKVILNHVRNNKTAWKSALGVTG